MVNLPGRTKAVRTATITATITLTPSDNYVPQALEKWPATCFNPHILARH